MIIKYNKKTILVIITILIVVGSVFSLLWFLGIFVDEFNYVYIIYDNNNISITANPSDLFRKKVSPGTDISAVFKNNSSQECSVAVRSNTLKKDFTVEPGSEYGVIVPKREDISILFCGIPERIRINK